jgi:hypothetical protein
MADDKESARGNGTKPKKAPNFAKVPISLVSDKELTKSEMQVLMDLYSNDWDQDQVVIRSRVEIAESTKISVCNVSHVIKRLQDKGRIKKSRRKKRTHYDTFTLLESTNKPGRLGVSSDTYLGGLGVQPDTNQVCNQTLSSSETYASIGLAECVETVVEKVKDLETVNLAQLALRECAKSDPLSLNGEDSIGQVKGEPQQRENPGILINDHPQQIEVPITLVTDQAQLEEPNLKIDSQGKEPTTKSKLQNSGSSRDAGRANGAYSEAFEWWWNAYPRKKDKVRAYKAWRRKKLDSRADELIADVKKRLAEDPNWIDLQYIPYPERYINSERWNDDITQPSPTRTSNNKPAEPKMPIPPIVRASEKPLDPVDIDAVHAQIQEARRRIYGQTQQLLKENKP